MADITLPYTPTTGVVSSASGFNSDVYHPTSPTPDSFDVINGFLDRANRETTATVPWKVPWNKIRPKSCAESLSVGATANLDYFGVMFPASSSAPGAFIPIPGASIEVYARRAGGTILVVAQLVIANSMTAASGLILKLMRRAPSDTALSEVAASQQQVATGDLAGTRRTYRDRQYAFHFLDIGVVRGNYEYAVGVWMGGASAQVTLDANGYPTVNLYTSRVRARAITADWTG